MRRTILTFTMLLTTLLLGSGVALAATIVGNGGDDTRKGTANRDVMYGLGGNDSLNGRGGNDEIDGGADSDTVYADRTSDGDPVNDILYNCETVN